MPDIDPDHYHVALEAVAGQDGQPPAFPRLVTLLDDAHLLARGLDEVYEELDQLSDYEGHLDGLHEAWILANLTVSAAHRAVDELICPRCLEEALGHHHEDVDPRSRASVPVPAPTTRPR
jgi:hypothetical protein